MLTFTLNGEPAQPNYLVPVDEGQPLINLELVWEVEDNPGTKVILMPAPGDVPTVGTLPVPLSPEPGETLVSLQVTNIAGEQLMCSITITTYGANNDAVRIPVPGRPGTVSPQELPPQFE